MLIQHDLVHAVWHPMVEITRYLRYRARLASTRNMRLSGQVVPAGV